MFCAMYIISLGFAAINYNSWGLNDYSSLTFSIVFGGAIIFILIEFICKFVIYHFRFRRVINKIKHKRVNKIVLNKYVTIFIIVLNLFTIILWYKALKNSGLGFSSFSDMMQNYRATTSYSLDSQDIIPGYLQQLAKLLTVCGYFYSFALFFNLANKTIKKADYYLCIPNIVIYIIYSILDSNRLNLLGLVGAFVIYYFAIKNVSQQHSNSVKSLFKLIVSFVIVLFVFYGIRLIVGRTGSEDTDFISYISMYVGAPVKLLDMFIKQPVSDFTVWGKETFVSINSLLRKMGFDIPKYLMHKEFRIYNGISLGNVYSAYRSWYSDFGLIGVFSLQSIFSIFYTCYYYILKKKGILNHQFAFLLYGYFSLALFLHPIEDWFYSMFVSVGTLTFIIIFAIIYKIAIKDEIYIGEKND
ncbi:oligosaccharide repeat unit polymerase [Lactobacillus mulieris]|uniref:Oligosaccharide repeat unit polymerase n=1 Tax=Lactobacillus mulieris TaxID=2508708 RepID=A0AAW5WZC2_9LACO|nr:oligosaccharide repeat unit polymerase [Lactobacillus mulieris]MCZ9678508.1 oligosaccharide repeat unit polymerase [Lactobacillus mulieris]